MSATSVSISMTPRRCPQTGVTIPECSCRSCCRALVSRYAPALCDPEPADPARRLAAQPLLTLGQYGKRHGISPEAVRKQAAEREVRV
jgi:hypothetical protein